MDARPLEDLARSGLCCAIAPPPPEQADQGQTDSAPRANLGQTDSAPRADLGQTDSALRRVACSSPSSVGETTEAELVEGKAALEGPSPTRRGQPSRNRMDGRPARATPRAPARQAGPRGTPGGGTPPLPAGSFPGRPGAVRVPRGPSE